MRILIPIGTRQEIVKLAPTVHLLRRRGFDVRVVDTGQHDDHSLASIFFERFGLVPDETWEPPASEHLRVAYILEHAFIELDERRPDCVLVVGSSYTVPIFCLAARRYSVPVLHAEAGMRSFDETSLDDVLSRIAAQTASLHLAPTQSAARFLEHEGVDHRRIRVVGSPLIDALRVSGVIGRPPQSRSGVTVLADRGDSVADLDRLSRMVELILGLSDEFGSVTFPVQARTRTRLLDSGDWSRLQRSGVRLFPPLPFDGIAELVATSRVVVSGSGGLQEEAAWVGVPVVVLRPSTAHWEGVAAGIAVLTGLEIDRALQAVRDLTSDEAQERVRQTPCPYGEGRAAEQIADLLIDPEARQLLSLQEPDLVGTSIDVSPSGELLVGGRA